DACNPEPSGRFFRLGAKVESQPLLTNQSTPCYQTHGAHGFGEPQPFRYELGEEVPASAFPSVRTVDEGKGRLRVRTLETLDGRHLARSKIVDTVAGETCTPTLVDGRSRCMPDDQVWGVGYAAADCTGQLIAPVGDTCGRKFVVITAASTCLSPAPPPR